MMVGAMVAGARLESSEAAGSAASLAAEVFARAAAEIFECGAIVYGIGDAAEPELFVWSSHDVDPARLARQAELSGLRFRKGEHLPGRVWQAERSLLIPEVDTTALSQTAHPVVRPLILELEVQSRMLAPASRNGVVCGVFDLVRCGRPSPPFTEADLLRLESLAARFAAAVGRERLP